MRHPPHTDSAIIEAHFYLSSTHGQNGYDQFDDNGQLPCQEDQKEPPVLEPACQSQYYKKRSLEWNYHMILPVTVLLH